MNVILRNEKNTCSTGLIKKTSLFSLKNNFFHFISWILITQFLFGSLLWAAPPASGSGDAQSSLESLDVKNSETPEVKAFVSDARQKTELLIAELEDAKEGQLPQKVSDHAHLSNQSLEAYSYSKVSPEKKAQGVEFISESKSYNLSDYRVELPSFFPDFDSEVQVSLNAQQKELNFDFVKNGKKLATHRLRGFEAVSYARNKEVLHFLTADGKIFAIDMILARSVLFSQPVPVFEVADLSLTHLKLAQSTEGFSGVKLAYVTRGFRPANEISDEAFFPDDLKNNDHWKAGDLVVFREMTKDHRVLEAVLADGITRMQLQSNLALLSVQAMMLVSPDKRNELDEALKELQNPLNSISLRDKVLKSSVMDPLTRDAILALPATYLKTLASRPSEHRSSAKQMRDIFSTDQLHKDYSEIQQYARDEVSRLQSTVSESKKESEKKVDALLSAIAAQDFQNHWKEYYKSKSAPAEASVLKEPLYYRILSHSALRKLGYIALGLGAWQGLMSLMDYTHFTGVTSGPAWFMHATNTMYEIVYPAVLKNAAYKATLIKSSLSLLVFVPMMRVIGGLVGKAKGWDSAKGMAVLGIRIYAQVLYNFIGRIAQFFQQKTFMSALAEGRNPFAPLSKKSGVAKQLNLSSQDAPTVFPGLNIPFGSKETVELNRKVLEAVHKQNERLALYSKTLANLVVGEKNGIDPVTMWMASQGKWTEAVMDTVLNPEFQKESDHLSRELSVLLNSMRSNEVQIDLASIPAEQLVRDYKYAQIIAQKIKSRSNSKKVLALAKTKWMTVSSDFYKMLASFGLEQYGFLSQVEPSKFVSEVGQRQFEIDYSLAVLQMGTFGARADLSNPSALAADPNGILYTNRAHFGDMGDQVVIYGISVPAGNVQVYQRTPDVREESFEPVESIVVKGKEDVQSFWESSWSWTKGVFNLYDANYGGLFYKSVLKRKRSIQASIFMSMFSRMALAGQQFSPALLGMVYGQIWGTWAYGWLWMPITSGIDRYQEHSKELAAKFLDIKVRAGQALRLDQIEKINATYDELGALYERQFKNQMPKEFAQAIQKSEALIDSNFFTAILDSKSDWAENKKVFQKLMGPLVQLHAAVQNPDSNADAVADAHQALVEQYLEKVSGETNSVKVQTKQMKEALLKLNAQSLLNFALENPPFGTIGHPGVESAATYLGAVLTTLWASTLSVDSFDPNKMNLPFLGMKLIESASIYAGLYFGQKALNRGWENFKLLRSYLKGEVVVQSAAKAPASFEEYLERYLHLRADEFGVGVADARLKLSDGEIKILRGRYEALVKEKGVVSGQEPNVCEKHLTDRVKPSLSLKEKLKVLAYGSKALSR